jgi:arsenate reductase
MNVLFAGSTNSGRSLMAERLFQAAAGDRHRVYSAGTHPADTVSPEVVPTLAEVGVDADDAAPRLLDDDALGLADVVVLTCDDGCLIVPGTRYVRWELPSVKGEPIERVREIRDAIRGRIEKLAAQLDASPPRRQPGDDRA